MYKDLKTENIRLKQTIKIMTQENMKQGQAIEELKLSVADLKRRLVRHDNYNTRRHKKGDRGGPTQRGRTTKIMPTINLQKPAGGKRARGCHGQQ